MTIFIPDKKGRYYRLVGIFGLVPNGLMFEGAVGRLLGSWSAGHINRPALSSAVGVASVDVK